MVWGIGDVVGEVRCQYTDRTEIKEIRVERIPGIDQALDQKELVACLFSLTKPSSGCTWDAVLCNRNMKSA